MTAITWVNVHALLASTAAWIGPSSPSPAQQPRKDFHEIKGAVHANDPRGTWTIDFRFKDLRFLAVDVPGKGKQTFGYLWYEVANPTDQPRTFVPSFELIDMEASKVSPDQVIPAVIEAVRKVEDPKGRIVLHNSVTVAKNPLPAAKKGEKPRRVTGVAVWEDVDPGTTRHAIFVSGLSNGWVATKEGKILQKTLQIQFKRDGQIWRLRGDPAWTYRSPTAGK